MQRPFYLVTESSTIFKSVYLKNFPSIRIIDEGIIILYNEGTRKHTVSCTEMSYNMIATKQMDIRANLKKYFDIAFEGEPVIVKSMEKLERLVDE